MNNIFQFFVEFFNALSSDNSGVDALLAIQVGIIGLFVLALVFTLVRKIKSFAFFGG